MESRLDRLEVGLQRIEDRLLNLESDINELTLGQLRGFETLHSLQTKVDEIHSCLAMLLKDTKGADNGR